MIKIGNWHYFRVLNSKVTFFGTQWKFWPQNGQKMSKNGKHLKNSDKWPGSQPNLIKIGIWDNCRGLNPKITFLCTQWIFWPQNEQKMSKKGINLKKSYKSSGSQPNFIKIGNWHNFRVVKWKVTFLGTQWKFWPQNGQKISKKGLNLKKSDKSSGSQPNLIKIGIWDNYRVLNSKITFFVVPSGYFDLEMGRKYAKRA